MKTPLPQLTLLVFCFFLSSLLAGQYTLETRALTAAVLPSGFHNPEAVHQVSLDHRVTTGHQEDAMVLTLPVGDEQLVFELHRRELRSQDFRRRFTSGRTDDRTQLSAQFIGRLRAEPASVAYFTFDDHFLMGHWVAGGVKWVLEPLWLTLSTAAQDHYLLYREDNLAESNAQCTVPGNAVPGGAGRSGGWIGSRDIELAVAVDNLMYRQFPDAGSVENFVLGLLNLVQGDYDRGFQGNLCFQLVDLYLSDSPEREVWDSTTLSEALIDNFLGWGNTNVWANRYDMAALWTGRDLRTVDAGFNNIGYAYIDATCGLFRYHVVENWSQNSAALRAIWSHEIGHNLGARHVEGDALIMNPNLGPRNSQWSQSARQAISNSLPGFSCLELSPWLSFSAFGEQRASSLFWSYTWREANTGFFVERANLENGVFSPLDWVPANENIGDRRYEYIDGGLAPGSVYYYRLRQVNDDGEEYISPVLRVVISYPQNVRISPNPATDVIRIVSTSNAITNYRITDVTGRVVISGRVFLGGTDVDLTGLDAGVYLYYEVDEKEVRFVTKLVKR